MRTKLIISILMLLLTTLACASSETVVPTEVSAPTDELISTDATPTAPPAEPTAVEHKTKPGEFPEQPSGVVGDQDSSITAESHRAPGGDRFTFTRFERPFNAESMDEYYPVIDILEGVLYEDDAWIYVSMKLKGDQASPELTGRYGFELDLNVDGGGEWLILASDPTSTEWTTDGVEAWFDTNDDVGGEVATTTDKAPSGDDGYETQVFASGVGDDPDLAWVRLSPDDPNTIHLAVKKDILKDSTRFLAGLWAGEEDLDPAMFEHSDHFTHEQAGAALTELEYFYPIKEVSAIDNTCRMAVGFQPSGSEPGLCPLPPAPGGGEPAVDAGCPTQYLVCQNVSQLAVVLVCYCNQP